MWPVSDRWNETVSRSHTVLAYVQILVDNDPVLTADGSTDDVVLVEGSIHIGEGVVRRTADVTLSDNADLLVPVVEKGFIIPGLCELRIYAGVQYWDVTEAEVIAGTDAEFVPVFTGPIMSYDLSDYPEVKLGCSDRMAYVQRPFSAPYDVAAGLNNNVVMERILRAKVPPAKLEMNIPFTTFGTTQLVYDEQADPADKLRELATASGWTVYVDQDGVFQAAVEPENVPDQSVFDYVEGLGGALIKPALSGSTENVVNTWVVTGESINDAGTPYGKAIDTDPKSPTFVRGTFDEWPRFISSPILISDAQCRLAAQTYRRRESGISDSLQVQVFPNPALDKGDVILVTGGLVDRFMICDSFDLDLKGSAQTITARAGVLTGTDTDG